MFAKATFYMCPLTTKKATHAIHTDGRLDVLRSLMDVACLEVAVMMGLHDTNPTPRQMEAIRELSATVLKGNSLAVLEYGACTYPYKIEQRVDDPAQLLLFEQR